LLRKKQLFCCLPRIERILAEFCKLEIVISSTWRDNRSLAELREYFSLDCRSRVIDVTPSWKDIPEIVEVIHYQRHAEIEGWLRRSKEPWRPWIAIDDKAFLFRPFLDNLVKTNPAVGFDDSAERQLRTKLHPPSNMTDVFAYLLLALV
jgi:hypothetical protein